MKKNDPECGINTTAIYAVAGGMSLSALMTCAEMQTSACTVTVKRIALPATTTANRNGNSKARRSTTMSDSELDHGGYLVLTPKTLHINVGRIEVNLDKCGHGTIKVDGINLKAQSVHIFITAGEAPVVSVQVVP
jgi:hypothetical protein